MQGTTLLATLLARQVLLPMAGWSTHSLCTTHTSWSPWLGGLHAGNKGQQQESSAILQRYIEALQ